MGRVLVVEDDEQLARLLTRVLSGSGLTVQWAPNGTEGLDIAVSRAVRTGSPVEPVLAVPR